MNIQQVRTRSPKRTSLFVAILTGNERSYWLHPDLLQTCLRMTMWQQETGSQLSFTTVVGATPVDAARNTAVERMLESGAEWLLQIDNDVVPPLNCLAVLEQIGDRKVFGLPCAMAHVPGDAFFAVGTRRGESYELHRTIAPGWSEVDMVGTGCFFVHRDVLRAISAPWFECVRVNGIYSREDTGFCEKAKTKGFKVWTHSDFPCKHYHTVDLLQMMSAIPRALQEYHQALTATLGCYVPTPSDLRKSSTR